MEGKILLFDLEVSAEQSFHWGGRMYDQNLIKVLKPTYLLTASWKWLDGVQETKGLPDYRSFGKNKQSDKDLVKELWQLLDKADILIGHNINEFDCKVLNARFAFYGMHPPSPYRTIDTLKLARSLYRFDSNKLDDLGGFLGLGEKVKHEGFELWEKCMNGDPKAFKEMCRYNKQDVLLLEKIYLHFRPFIKNHPNVSVFDEKSRCTHCGSHNLEKRGFTFTQATKTQRYQCKDCHAWCSGRKNLLEVKPFK